MASENSSSGRTQRQASGPRGETGLVKEQRNYKPVDALNASTKVTKLAVVEQTVESERVAAKQAGEKTASTSVSSENSSQEKTKGNKAKPSALQSNASASSHNSTSTTALPLSPPPSPPPTSQRKTPTCSENSGQQSTKSRLSTRNGKDAAGKSVNVDETKRGTLPARKNASGEKQSSRKSSHRGSGENGVPKENTNRRRRQAGLSDDEN